MARLAFCCLLLSLGDYQEPVGGSSSEQNPNLVQVQESLASPDLDDDLWRIRLWNSLRRLEHHPSPLISRAWEILSKSNTPADRANYLLYLRRHNLKVDWQTPLESSEVALEWALYLWGSGDNHQLSQFLPIACQQFSEDTRLADNLLWFEFRPPSQVPLEESPREMALSILTRRGFR